jgi:hypothetical protein
VDDLKAPLVTRDRLRRNFIVYIDALSEEARDRETGRLRTEEQYLELRRRASALYSAFDFLVLPWNFPEEVADHEMVRTMTLKAVDLVAIANDIYSYNFEQAEAGGPKRIPHNIVDVVVRERKKGLQDAMDVVAGKYRKILLSLLDDRNNMPNFQKHEQNEVLKEYVLGLLDWVEGNVEFSLDSPRYFRERAGAEIRNTRWTELFALK